jgi:hypothetical protein
VHTAAEENWEALASILREALGDEAKAHGEPIWVLVMDTHDGSGEFELTIKTTEGGLFGWRAPEDCLAVGMVASGRARTLDASVEPPGGSRFPSTDGVTMACLLTRSGEIGWVMEAPGGERVTTPPEEGRMLDCLRRNLGLPTPPPPAPGDARALVALTWLAGLVEMADLTGQRFTWREVLAVHPLATGELTLADLPSPGLTLEEVEERVLRGHAGWDWERLRRLAVDEAWAFAVMTPEIADWMDEGMFARSVLSNLVDADEILEQVRAVVTPAAGRRLTHAARVAGCTFARPAAA